MNKYLVTLDEANKIYTKEFISFQSTNNSCEKRNFHAFCVGTPKSGTHSIENIFKGYKTKHEPNNIFMIELMDKLQKKKISKEEVTNILKYRDMWNCLEMDSSHYNGHFIEELYSLFPNAKYIFTIRDCISWLNSWFNHQLSAPPLDDNLIKNVGRNIYYNKEYSYTKYDNFLKEYKLFPIQSYLKFWYEHNKRILDVVPKDKLLILKTHSISDSLPVISNFMEINESEISSYSSHEGITKSNFNLLKKIDSNFLIEVATKICSDLNIIYFPDKEIKNTIQLIKGE